MDLTSRLLSLGSAGVTTGAAPGLDVDDVFSTFTYAGNGGTQTIKNGIALANEVVIAPGTALGGGFFAGFISTTANGVATHALIASPKSTETSLIWKTSNTSTPGTASVFDGAANTAAMNNSSHPAAQYCAGLTTGGFTDWYLPARLELDIAYEILKPTTTNNSTSYGINAYSVPVRTVNRTTTSPSQTAISAFQSGGAEAFSASYYLSSTEVSATDASILTFANGTIATTSKDLTGWTVRAFRKIPINDPLLDAYRVTGEGGLVWLKKRNNSAGHYLVDTVRGNTQSLRTDSTVAESTNSIPFNSFNADGFTLGNDSEVNSSLGDTMASWTFRKAPKFFDIVTYTGTGAVQTIPHNLGSVPGAIIIKRRNSTSNWPVYHRGLATPQSQYMSLNLRSAVATSSAFWNNTLPTSTEFTVGTDASVNASGGTYVAYIFAHDAGGFGDGEEQSIISCGSYVGNGSTNGPEINLGWQPQWLLIKDRDTGNLAREWVIRDKLRGLPVGANSQNLCANLSGAETSSVYGGLTLTATGWKNHDTDGAINANGINYIYIAIRNGPINTPTDGTKVFSAKTSNGNAASTDFVETGFPADLLSFTATGAGGAGVNSFWTNRITGFSPFAGNAISNGLITSNSTNIEGGFTSPYNVNNTGFNVGAYFAGLPIAYLAFRRAPSFFDIVAYTGTASTLNVKHGLSQVPQLIIIRNRVAGQGWYVYTEFTTPNFFLRLDSNAGAVGIGFWDGMPTATQFTLSSGGGNATNASGSKYIAYLFATCPGVSKVGSYTGTGTTLDIDCGFTAGARFVLIKRTDSTGDWYVWDTTRGIVSGNDPYLLFNSTAEVVTNTDYIDPLASGFQISSTAPAAINASGGSFIFLAIA